MSQKNKTFYILYRETWYQSILSDIFSFSVWVFPLLINKLWLGDKWYITIFFLFIGLIHILAVPMNEKTKFKNKKDLKKYLKKIK